MRGCETEWAPLNSGGVVETHLFYTAAVLCVSKLEVMGCADRRAQDEGGATEMRHILLINQHVSLRALTSDL